MGGKRGLAEEVAAHAAAVQGIAAVQARKTEVRLPEALASRRVSLPACGAVAAGLVGEDDVIAGLDGLQVSADFLHDAGPLMAQHHGGAVPVVQEIYICVADAAGDKTYQGFVRPRAFEFQGFEAQAAAAGRSTSALNLNHQVLTCSTILPRTCPVSLSSWALAAWASGRTS